MNAEIVIPKPFGPIYPDLGAGVAKFRRLAAKAGSIMDMPKAERYAYADAIEKAIHAKNRTLHMRPNPPTSPGWYKPTSIARLLRYENPLPMAGDPDWKADCNHRYYEKCQCDWGNRQAAVYAHTMEQKRSRAACSTVAENIFS